MFCIGFHSSMSHSFYWQKPIQDYALLCFFLYLFVSWRGVSPKRKKKRKKAKKSIAFHCTVEIEDN